MAYDDEEVVINVNGLDELGAQLESLDLAVQTRILEHALRYAGEVFVPELVVRAPINTDGVTDASHTTRLVPGMLKASMGVAVQMANEQGPTAFIGPDHRTAHVMNWIENGFNLTTHGSKSGRKVIRHIPANPVIRPVFDELSTQAIGAFGDALYEGVTAELASPSVPSAGGAGGSVIDGGSILPDEGAA